MGLLKFLFILFMEDLGKLVTQNDVMSQSFGNKITRTMFDS